jgi:hypothetical protein
MLLETQHLIESHRAIQATMQVARTRGGQFKSPIGLL